MTTWCEAWPPVLGLGLFSWLWSLSGFSATLYCHQLCPFAGSPKFWWWLSLDQAGSGTWVRQRLWSLFPTVTLRGFSCPCAGLGVSCLFGGEASVPTYAQSGLFFCLSTPHSAPGPDGCLHEQPAIAMATQYPQILLLILFTEWLR